MGERSRVVATAADAVQAFLRARISHAMADSQEARTVDSRISEFGQGCSTGETSVAFNNRMVHFGRWAPAGRAQPFWGIFTRSRPDSADMSPPELTPSRAGNRLK